MKTVDFLFLYEVKSRELENICLLKYEIERRGYSTKIINTWQYLYKEKPNISARVVMVFALYNNEVFNFIKQYVNTFEKIINLQWEQVYCIKDEENRNSYYNIEGVAKKAIHISWGERNCLRLVDFCNVPVENVKICGHIALDFLREEFNGYYEKRVDILSKYHISANSKVFLFISSFMTTPDKDIKQYKATGDILMEMKKITLASQKILLGWFKKLLEDDKENYYIYRPHPTEVVNNQLLTSLERKYKNFLIISDYSVKQWIKIADKLFTWYSTSIVEAYAAGKTCEIVRPIKIPSELDMQLYQDARIINNFSDFKRAFYYDNKEYPISPQVINQIYSIKKDLPSYQRICNVMEDVIKNKNVSLFVKPHSLTNKNKVKNFLYLILMNENLMRLFKLLSRKHRFFNKNLFLEQVIYQYDMINSNSTNDKEIEFYIRKIKLALKKNR